MMRHCSKHEQTASSASCIFAASDVKISTAGRLPWQAPLDNIDVRSGLLGRFELNVLLRGGDAVRVEGLSARSDYQKRKMAHTHHKKEQAEREKMQMRFRSKAETRLRVVTIQGDGRCLFRALAKGLAHAKGQFVGGQTEEQDADELRMAVSDALCRGPERLKAFKEVLPSVEAFEGGLTRYCTRLNSPSFWGGEVEIFTLSKMLRVPIHVMQSAKDAGREEKGYVPIMKYGEEFEVAKKGRKERKPVKLLFSGSNHYDLLLPSLL